MRPAIVSTRTEGIPFWRSFMENDKVTREKKVGGSKKGEKAK